MVQSNELLKQQRWNIIMVNVWPWFSPSIIFPSSAAERLLSSLVPLGTQYWKILKWLFLNTWHCLFSKFGCVGTLLPFVYPIITLDSLKKWNTEEPWHWNDRAPGTPETSQPLHWKTIQVFWKKQINLDTENPSSLD